MSAIYGIIDFNSSSLLMNSFSTLANEYRTYKIDRFEKMSVKNASFGCGIQYFTKESENEILPIYDEKQQILFVCDCVLDNRSELLQELSEYADSTPDGKLLFASYLKWGKDFHKHVLGAFSFVVYHLDCNTAFLYTDHMGNRSLYFSYQNHKLYFSTLIVPLAKTLHAKLCEKWIAGCLSNYSADMMLFPDLTPYEKIIQCSSGSSYCIQSDKIQSEIYYGIENQPKFPKKFDPNVDYQSTFINTLNTCVTSMMRSTQETGCTLSGGLDSTSIAAFASLHLQEEGKILHSYTSVPLAAYKGNEDSTAITNETEGVNCICEKYSNIKPQFFPCEGKDAFSGLAQLVTKIGYPMKSGTNLIWLNEIYQKASKDGCKLMLKGQYGNSTISYGQALGTFYQLILRGNIKQAYHTLNNFCKNYHVPRKYFLQCFWSEFINKSKMKKISLPPNPLAKEKIKQHHIDSRLLAILKNSQGQMDSRKQRLGFIFNPIALYQLGMFDTVMSLIHGVLIRDPSKDIRIVNLCCRFPIECTLAGYVERGMIRTYMKDFLPAQIRNDYYRRGVQSADYSYRTKQLWEQEREGIIDNILYSSITTYLSEETIQTLHELRKATSEDLSEEDIRMTNVLFSCASLFQ